MSTQAASADLEATIARTALKYDLLPYVSNPFPQTIPARTGAIARLFGLNPAPMETARILELGCASGGNIIPLASRYPKARFIGVDLSRTQVAAGRARIAALGLTNIEILCQSFTELNESVGTFDYLVCHGVYSWVPGPVREAILRIARERLAPDGIANISYNVLPGWRMMQAMRDAFQIAVPDQLDSRARVAQARAFLSVLREQSAPAGPYAEMLRTWDERFKSLPEDYIAHEFLEEVNEPCTFRDFISGAEQAGLSYLGDSDLPSMILDNQSPQAAEKVRAYAGNNLVATEQMLDMISGRTFRQTLLVHGALNGRIVRNLTPAALEGMHFIGSSELKAAQEGANGVITDSAGRRMTTAVLPVMTALEQLVKRFPGSATLEDMLGALSANDRKTYRDMVYDAVFRMVIAGLLIPLTEPVPAAATVSAKPRASAVARLDAGRGEASTASLRHERVALDPAARALLPLLDGQHERPALVQRLLSEAKSGRIGFNENGVPVTDAAGMARLAETATDQLLTGIARAGLLEA
ncbi:MAG: methyltransferase regulatory domain-containing protein [Beijerinckiaceae bacterium]